MEEKKEMSVIDKILTEENDENIVLYDEKDNAIEFEQIAVIPVNNLIYAILKPVTKIDGVGEDEAVVFLLEDDESNNSDLLTTVTDEKVIEEVFNVYYKLLDETESDEKAAKAKAEKKNKK